MSFLIEVVTITFNRTSCASYIGSADHAIYVGS